MTSQRQFWLEADPVSWEVIREALRGVWASAAPSPSMSASERATARRERMQAEACLRLVTATLRAGHTQCDFPLRYLRFVETACAELGWRYVYAERQGGEASADQARRGREAFALAAHIARTINREADQGELVFVH